MNKQKDFDTANGGLECWSVDWKYRKAANVLFYNLAASQIQNVFTAVI